MPPFAVNAFNSLVHTMAGQSESSWSIFELFKGKFSGGYSSSSSESWAISDLHTAMMAAADNAPVFISTFWDGVEQVLGAHPEVGLPDADVVNQILYEHEVPYEVRPPGAAGTPPSDAIVVQAPEKSLGERAHALLKCLIRCRERQYLPLRDLSE